MKLADLVAAGGYVVASGRTLGALGEHPALAQARGRDARAPYPLGIIRKAHGDTGGPCGGSAGSPLAPMLFGGRAVGRRALERGVE